ELDEDETEVILEHPVPEYWMEDEDVEGLEFGYSTRAEDDWVSSGPLGAHGIGPGRRFAYWDQAEAWARTFFGPRFKGVLPEAQREGDNGWAFRIRGRGLTNEEWADRHGAAPWTD